MGRITLARLLPGLGALAVLFLASAAPPPAGAAGFTVSIAPSAITGQEGKVLLITADPAEGTDKVACAAIDAAIFENQGFVLKELPQGGDPCAPGSPDAFLLPGTLNVTAGIYVPGEQTPEKQVTASFNVQDDSAFGIDGVALTADSAGDADCNRKADAVDALHVLRNVAGIGVPASCLAAANLKCDDGFSTVDALFILRHVAALSLALPAGCPSPLAAPVLVSPEDGAVIHTTVPRMVPLDWGPVAGAPNYLAQVDCAGCCAGGQYCSEVGRPYRLAVVEDSEYTVQVGGDNLQRWRAWAINEDGTPGDFATWRTFQVDTSVASRWEPGLTR